MKLTLQGIKDTAAWTQAGIKLPAYDVEAVAKRTKENPVWVHFGAGNIFRIFIGGIADKLLTSGEMDRGITCVETFDFDVVDKIYDKSLKAYINSSYKYSPIKAVALYALTLLHDNEPVRAKHLLDELESHRDEYLMPGEYLTAIYLIGQCDTVDTNK